MPSYKVMDYKPRGAVRTLLRQCLKTHTPPMEVLLEGPANTGKSRGVCELCHYLCEDRKNVRILWVRNTRVDLSESVLRTFEDIVLPPGHYLLEKGLKRSHRDSYEYRNGSKIVLGGMNNPHKFRSAEYDIIVFFEATEGLESDYEMLLHRLRAGNLKRPDGSSWHLIIADTNPDAESHWLNVRANKIKDGKPVMVRMVTSHADNPWIYDDAGKMTENGKAYLERLESLTGVRRERYLKGRWCAAEGAIWPEFSRARHVIHDLKRPIRWAVGGVDWGYRAPGCVHVYGVDSEGCVTLLREVYQRGWSINPVQGDDPNNPSRPSWVQRVKRLMGEIEQEFDVRPTVFVCDSAEPRSIEDFRVAGIPVREAIKETAPSLDAVRRLLRDERLYFLSNCNREMDQELVNDPGLRCGSVLHEIENYVYAELVDGKPVKEEPHPKCVDHGVDVLRYVSLWIERKDLTPSPARVKYPEGSYGAYFNHAEEMENERLRELGWLE